MTDDIVAPEDIELNLLEHPEDVSTFAIWLADRLSSGRPISVDTETTGLKWWTPRFTRLLQIGDTNGGWAIPIDWYGRVAHHALADIAAANVTVVMHNASFDMHALEGDGYPVPAWRNISDTMVAHHLVTPHKSHALKTIARETLGSWTTRGQHALRNAMRENRWSWDTVPVDLPEYWGYGVLDTVLTARIHDELDPPAEPYDREMAYLAVMYAAETRGIRIDTEHTSTLLAEWRRDIDQLAAQMKDRWGITNPHSNRQVESALIARGWEPSEFTETGQAKLDRHVLSSLDIEPELAQALIAYKRKVKWASAYLEHFLDEADPEGYVHPSIRTLGARTGRSSITNPPLQTLPKRDKTVRRCVIPPEGKHLWAIDYDGQEARIFAAYARDPEMTEVFTRGDGDIHSLVARQVFGSEFTPEERDVAKMITFLRIYGGGAGALSRNAGIPEPEAKAILNQYNSAFPAVDRFMARIEATAKERMLTEGEAYVTTSGGRKVVADHDHAYKLTNYLVQGSAADVTKDAVIRLDQAGLASAILLPVHDEVLFAFDADDTDSPREAARLMHDDSFPIPLTVGVEGPLERWGQ